MKTVKPKSPGDSSEEIATLIETLHQTGQQLEQLTGGEVDSVANRDGKTFLLQHAQDRLRLNDSARQAAVLNALPANIALLDPRGNIVSVNLAWQQFGDANAAHHPGHELGVDYLAVCDKAQGDDAAEASRAAAGIRAVLGGTAGTFSLEYPCHSPTEQRWFRMTVTPMAGHTSAGVVVMHLNITEGKLAENALRQSEEEFHTLAEAMPQIVWITRADGWTTYINQHWVDYTGLPLAEGLGRGWNTSFHPDDRQHALEVWEKMTATGDIYAVEIRLRRADGTYRWWLVRGVPLLDEDGAILKWFGTCTDIHDLKLAGLEIASANAELRESEARFRALTAMSSDFYWQSDAEHRLSTRAAASRKASTVSAFERGTTIGKRRWEIPHVSPDEAGWQAHRAVLDAHLPFRDFELSRIGGDGSERHISVSGDPMFSGSGAFEGYRGVGSDITERKRSEEEIRFKNTILNTQQETSLDAILVVDDAGHIISYNQNFIDLWRLPAQLVSARVDAPVRQSVADQVANSEAFVARVRYLNEHREDKSHDEISLKDGRIIDRYSAPAIGADHKYHGRVWYFRDVTERKATEHRIAYLNRVYAMLSGINTRIVHAHDHDKLFDEACSVAVDLGGFRMAWIGIVDRRAKKIVLAGSAGVSDELHMGLNNLFSSSADALLGMSLAAQVVRERKVVIINDVPGNPLVAFGRQYAESGIESIAILPLVVSDAVVGVLALYAGEREFFHEEELKLLTELAGNIAFAIENIDRENKLAKLARVRKVSSSINSAIIRIKERDALFNEVCRVAVDDGGFRMSLVVIADEHTMQLVPVASAGKNEALVGAVIRVLSSTANSPNTMVARSIREKKALVSSDAKSDPQVLFGKQYVDAGVHSMAVLPLLVADEAIGVLALYAHESGFFDDEEMVLLTEVARDIAFALDHIDKAKKLDYLAYYDELTGLANRSLFLERVTQYLRFAADGGHKLGVFLIDLERFKNINDSLGRPAGDALLRQVTEWLTRNTGDASLLARMGADHFALLLPQLRQDGDVSRLLEKTMSAFLEHPFRLNDAVFRISARVGAAVFPDDGGDAETLLKNAEAALKKTKARGDRYLFYTQKMTDSVAIKLNLENQLRVALRDQEFVLHYQPKVNLVSGKVTSAEALIRWNDPRTGLVPPGRFIPVLEEIGLIHEVGRWALRQAMEDYLRWRAAGLPAVRIAVNVSALQLRNRGFIEEIRQAIGVDPQAAAGLELEITESLIMEDVKGTIASLQAIRELGVRIAIDDFGTGFSSLAYLAKLPVDTLKIDRSFVVDMTAAPEGLALVSTIVNLAHSLKLNVVAEGVETEEQSRLLRLLACDEMQGFLFSKPVPSEIFETRFLAPPRVKTHVGDAGRE